MRWVPAGSARMTCGALLALLLGISLAGCATVPMVEVYRPWKRVLQEGEPIHTRATFRLSVEGEASTLLGDSRLVNIELKDRLADLMERRGLDVGAPAPEFEAKLMYRTQASERSDWSSSFSTSSSNMTGVGVGLGVLAAQSVGAQFNRSASSAVTTGGTRVVYAHVLTLEVRRTDGLLVWKGESMWDSRHPDIIPYSRTGIQLLLSGFPSDSQLRIPVPAVKKSGAESFYQQFCDRNEYACPALPNPIVFNPSVGGMAIPMQGFDSIKSRRMLAAYVDLVQTAEFAVPAGDERDWEKPVEPGLWRHATIGGRYSVGADRSPANVIIELRGTASNYVVASAEVVSDEEYAKFEERLAKWRAALQTYFDVYER